MTTPGKMAPMECEKFRKLIERSGIMETVTRALVRMYEEQIREPEEAMEFFRRQIAVDSGKEMEEAKSRIQELEANLAVLQAKIATEQADGPPQA